MAKHEPIEKPAEPTPEPAPVFAVSQPVPVGLNGKTTGKYKLKDHNGKIVHATDDKFEVVALFKRHAVTHEETGAFWTIEPVDPRLENDPAYLAKLQAKQVKKDKELI